MAFGGSGGLALLGGVARGLTEARKEKREAKRQAILTRLKRRRIEQARDRINLERAAESRRAEASERSEEVHESRMGDRESLIEENVRQMQAAGVDLPENVMRGRARALAAQGTTFEESQRDARSDEALSTARSLRAEATRDEMETQEDTDSLLGGGDVNMKNIRTALRNVSNKEELNKIRELANSNGIRPDAFDAAAERIVGESIGEDTTQPDEVEDVRDQATDAEQRIEAQQKAKELVEQVGSPESAINMLAERIEQAAAEGTYRALREQDPRAFRKLMSYQEALLDELEDMSDASGASEGVEGVMNEIRGGNE